MTYDNIQNIKLKISAAPRENISPSFDHVETVPLRPSAMKSPRRQSTIRRNHPCFTPSQDRRSSRNDSNERLQMILRPPVQSNDDRHSPFDAHDEYLAMKRTTGKVHVE